MNCVKFQDSLSDYLEGALDPRARAERAAHRLICGECRELYNDVRATVQALNALASGDAEPEGLPGRIIAHTTTGEMLSCGEFDKLLERYFDGVILAPTFQTFQSHFEKCLKCRRLLSGIEDAIVMLQDAKDAEVDVPGSLHDRIVAAEPNQARAIIPRQFRAGADVAADGGGGDDHRADQSAGHLALRQRRQSDHERRTEGREPGQSGATENQRRRRHGDFGPSAGLLRSERDSVQRRRDRADCPEGPGYHGYPGCRTRLELFSGAQSRAWRRSTAAFRTDPRFDGSS